MRKLIVLLPAFAGASFATPALAANYASLTSAVNFDDVATALLAVAAAIIAVLIVRKGIRFVLGMVR